MKKFGLFACFILLVAACQPVVEQTKTPTPDATAIPITLTVSPVLTTTLKPVITLIITPTPEEPKLILPGVPISLENISRLSLVASFGNGYASQMAWSPDGRWIAIATSREVALFSADDFRFQQNLPSSKGIRCLSFSPDGSLLAGGGADGLLIVWTTQDWQVEAQVQSGDLALITLAFNSDGTQLAVSSWDNTLFVWDAIIWQLRTTLGGHFDAPVALAFNSAGDTLFSFSRQEQVKRWTIPEGKPAKELYIGVDALGNTALSGSFSTDGAFFAAAQNNQVKVFETTKGTTSLLLTAFSTRVTSVLLSSNGSRLAVVAGTSLTVWDNLSGDLQKVYEFEVSPSTRLAAFSPDSNSLLLGGALPTILLLKEDRQVFPEGANFTLNAGITHSFNPSTYQASRIMMDGAVQQVDLLQGTAELIPGRNQVWNVADISLDGKWLAGGYMQGNITVWDRTMDSTSAHFSIHEKRNPITALAYDSQGKWLVGADSSNNLWIFDLKDGSVMASWTLDFRASDIQVSPDGMRLSASGGGRIQLMNWDSTSGWQSGQVIQGFDPTFMDDATLWYRTYSEDGSPLTAMNLENGEILHTFDVPAGEYAFSPGGNLLAVSGKKLWIFSLPENTLLGEWETTSPYAHPVFSADANALILVDWDGVVNVWGISE